MKAIEYSGFAPTGLNLATRKGARKTENFVEVVKNCVWKLRWLVHREPDFREQHILEKNLGPTIRQITW